MEFRTPVDTPQMALQIAPCEDILCVGSCFADEMARRFRDNGFPVVANPFGVMYNPASILHTIERYQGAPRVVFLTLGTNHVYRLKETGEIVDNCEKRPQRLFQEEALSVDACADYLRRSVALLCERREDVQVVVTVSPIRYRKYGYHGSQLSKATLLLSVDKVIGDGCWVLDDRNNHHLSPTTYHLSPTTHHPTPITHHLNYFPSYEIFMDELRDYRFYAADMLHPSEQAVDYVWERLVDACFSPEAKAMMAEWQPIRQALAHKPFHPESAEYQTFMDKTMLKLSALRKKYRNFAL